MAEGARLWDVASGTPVDPHWAPRGLGVAFSPDGPLLATTSGTGPRGCGTSPAARQCAPWRATLRGSRGGVQPGRDAARHRQPRQDRAAVGRRQRRASVHPDRPRRLGIQSGVRPGRDAARHRQHGQDRATVGAGLAASRSSHRRPETAQRPARSVRHPRRDPKCRRTHIWQRSLGQTEDLRGRPLRVGFSLQVLSPSPRPTARPLLSREPTNRTLIAAAISKQPACFPMRNLQSG